MQVSAYIFLQNTQKNCKEKHKHLKMCISVWNDFILFSILLQLFAEIICYFTIKKIIFCGLDIQRSFNDIQNFSFFILFSGNFADRRNALRAKLSVKLVLKSLSGNPDLKSFKKNGCTHFLWSCLK